MRLIKGFLIAFIGLFIFITLISLLIPNKIILARAVTVQADSTKAFNEISDLKNWKNWHPVFKNNPSEIFISNPGNQVNSYLEWTSGNAKNRLTIIEIKFPIVKIALQRKGENDVMNTLSIRPVQEQGNLQVQWQSITTLKWYPWDKFGGIFVEKLSGAGYEVALQSLKEYLVKSQ